MARKSNVYDPARPKPLFDADRQAWLRSRNEIVYAMLDKFPKLNNAKLEALAEKEGLDVLRKVYQTLLDARDIAEEFATEEFDEQAATEAGYDKLAAGWNG